MITKEEALEIAQREAEKLASTPSYKHRKYKPAIFYRDVDSAFVFFSACHELLAKDYAPGGFFLYVDKTYGHIWNQAEIENRLLQVA
jgi:hypothetical protein